MKICIDARSPGFAGILNYSSCLMKNLITNDSKNEYIILSAEKDKRWNLDGVKEIIIPSNNFIGWVVWSNSKLVEIMRRENVDIYHSLKHTTAFLGKYKKVITFHSARHFLFSQYYKWHEYAYWRIMNPLVAKKYDLIIVVSEAEKLNYIKYIGVPENKFRTIHLAADERFRIINDVEKLQGVRNRYNLPDQFILFVGRIHPIKNIETIVRAYYLLKKRKFSNHKLVIVGIKTWYYDEFITLIKELDIEGDVILTGPVYDELPCVYNLADLFLFPSYYEAFPAVPLEAMACGTPVLTVNSGGIPEVVGDAAVSVSPFNVDEFSDAISEILSSNSLRESMIQKGIERAGMFSWKRCAQETIKVYEELMLD